MNDVEAVLVRCFQAVFPGLDEGRIRTARSVSLEQWDSVATVNLLNLISEEFGIEADWDRLEELNSFDSALQMVRASLAGRPN